jgi:hypothetical protein
METQTSAMPQQSMLAAEPSVCSYCHQVVAPEWFFCPNCGKEVRAAPLSTSIETQLWIYAFSVILPFICYLAIAKWPGIKYFRSKDIKAQQIGTIAWALIIVSSLVTFWYGYKLVQQTIQSQEASINADMSITTQ